MGNLIVIEGVDSSGKETQSNLLFERLLSLPGKDPQPNVVKVEFPDYQSNSSVLARMYLNGEFGDKPDDVSPYAASVFFACDRYASYKTKWQTYYMQGGIVLADRYTTSNMIHQACKIASDQERRDYLSWLEDFEYRLMGIPKPDLVIFLDMPVRHAMRLMKKRNRTADIHEMDGGYLARSYDIAVRVARDYGWHTVCCADRDLIKTPQQIADEIFSVVKDFLAGNSKREPQEGKI